MAKLFRARGQALYGQIHLTLLVDEQATGAGIVQAIREVAAKARPQDVVVVFLAGHGAVVGQQYYFLPQGFQHKAATLDEDVAAQGLPAAEVNDVLGTVPALKRMLIFDTGQSGGQVGLARTGRDPFAFRGAIERLGRAQGNFAIACAAVSDPAQEVGPLKHGVLSYALLDGLHAVDVRPLPACGTGRPWPQRRCGRTSGSSPPRRTG